MVTRITRLFEVGRGGPSERGDSEEINDVGDSGGGDSDDDAGGDDDGGESKSLVWHSLRVNKYV